MIEETPFAHILHQETIEKLATGFALDRGRKYARDRRVRDLSSAGARLVAEVVGSEIYRVSIWVSNNRLAYVCSCPQGADGNFCKHCVAVAITWLERRA